MRASDNQHGSAGAPRIASGNCSVASAAANGSSSSAAAAEVYEKQLAWKAHGQRKLQHKSQELASREERACTFAPHTNNARRRGHPPADAAARDARAESPPPSPRSSCSDGPASAASVSSLHPTEAQESSIQLHLVRQERAREHAQDAHHKLFASAQRDKDYSKVTAFEPFKLSVGNQKTKRSSSASPTKTRARAVPAEPASGAAERGNGAKRSSRPTVTTPSSSTAASAPVSSQQQLSSQQHHDHESREDAWERERASLVALLDAQRRELEMREKAQQDAMRVAANFAAAIQSFEERLVAVETSSALELASIRELLQRQSAATTLILQSLGIAHLAPPPAPQTLSLSPVWSAEAPASTSPATSTSTALRRETK